MSGIRIVLGIRMRIFGLSLFCFCVVVVVGGGLSVNVYRPAGLACFYSFFSSENFDSTAIYQVKIRSSFSEPT